MSRHKLMLLAGSLSLAAAGQEPHGEDERSYLMRRQQEIFRLNVEIDYALALQKLCQTGFGDPRLCAPAIPKSASAPPSVSQEPQTVDQEGVLEDPVLPGLRLSLTDLFKPLT